MSDPLASAQSVLRSAERVVVLTGAGISTDSGIQDFRGPNGLWTKDPEAEKMATLQHYLADPELRRKAWRRRVEHLGTVYEPNAGHRALVELEADDRLDLLITQNIDGLHHRAGSDPDRIVEVHGSTREWKCTVCGERGPMADALERVRAGVDDPDCPVCEGIIKSATISFGENLVQADLRRSDQAARSCDVLLAVGSTLSVYPIANVVPLAKSVGASVIIVNGSLTEMDDLADILIQGSISEVLPKIVAP